MSKRSDNDLTDLIANALLNVINPDFKRIEHVSSMKYNLMDLSTSMNLFGVPVIVAGDEYPFRGHLYNLGIVKSGGEEYLSLDVGFFEVWARVITQNEKVYEYPVIVNGLPTISVLQVIDLIKDGSRAYYYLVGKPVNDRIIVKKDDILLFDAVVNNKLPMIVVDNGRALCSSSHDDAVEKGRLTYTITLLNKYYNECKKELDWATLERNMSLARASRYESMLKEVLIRFEEARSSLLELELEYRAYKTSLEVYKRQFTSIEDYASAVASRTRELEERLKQSLSLFESLSKKMSQMFMSLESMEPKKSEVKEKEEGKESSGELEEGEY